MNSIKDIINMVYTESVEFGGVQEIPGDQHGNISHFHASKRDARRFREGFKEEQDNTILLEKFDIGLIRDSNGVIRWSK